MDGDLRVPDNRLHPGDELLAFGTGPAMYGAPCSGGEGLDLGMAPAATPYGRDDLPLRTTVEPVGHDAVAATHTRQVGSSAAARPCSTNRGWICRSVEGAMRVGLEPCASGRRG